MLLRAPAARPLRGEVTVPGDKSVTHRVLWLGALAHGSTRLTNPNPGDDCRRLRVALGQLGCAVEESRAPSGAPVWTLHGRGLLTSPAATLDFGNSGTAARLGLGALAGAGLSACLDGDTSLRHRPMRRVVAPLVEMGARIEGSEGTDRLPLRIEPAALTGRDHRLAIASAQVKTALVFAGLAATGTTRIVEPAPSRDHTERLLPLFGAAVERDAGVAGAPPALGIRGDQRLVAAVVEAPRDFSAAAFWIVAATLVPGSEIALPGVSLNPLRAGLLPVLQRMGAQVRAETTGAAGGDPVGTVVARSSALSGTRISAEEVPSLLDEIPIWAIAAAAAGGVSEVEGAADLRAKESDRLTLLARAVRALGAEVEERPDGLRIEGTAGRPFRGGRFESGGDHRLAMAFLVAGLLAPEGLEVTAGEMVDTSDPGFYSSFLNLASPR